MRVVSPTRNADTPLQRIGKYFSCVLCEPVVIGRNTVAFETVHAQEMRERVQALVDRERIDVFDLVRRLAPGEVLPEARSSVLNLGGSHATIGITSLKVRY